MAFLLYPSLPQIINVLLFLCVYVSVSVSAPSVHVKQARLEPQTDLLSLSV